MSHLQRLGQQMITEIYVIAPAVRQLRADGAQRSEACIDVNALLGQARSVGCTCPVKTLAACTSMTIALSLSAWILGLHMRLSLLQQQLSV